MSCACDDCRHCEGYIKQRVMCSAGRRTITKEPPEMPDGMKPGDCCFDYDKRMGDKTAYLSS